MNDFTSKNQITKTCLMNTLFTKYVIGPIVLLKNSHITVTYKKSPGYPCDNYTHVAIKIVSKTRSSLSSDEVSSPFGSISDVPQPML